MLENCGGRERAELENFQEDRAQFAPPSETPRGSGHHKQNIRELVDERREKIVSGGEKVVSRGFREWDDLHLWRNQYLVLRHRD